MFLFPEQKRLLLVFFYFLSFIFFLRRSWLSAHSFILFNSDLELLASKFSNEFSYFFVAAIRSSGVVWPGKVRVGFWYGDGKFFAYSWQRAKISSSACGIVNGFGVTWWGRGSRTSRRRVFWTEAFEPGAFFIRLWGLGFSMKFRTSNFSTMLSLWLKATIIFHRKQLVFTFEALSLLSHLWWRLGRRSFFLQVLLSDQSKEYLGRGNRPRFLQVENPNPVLRHFYWNQQWSAAFRRLPRHLFRCSRLRILNRGLQNLKKRHWKQQ